MPAKSFVRSIMAAVRGNKKQTRRYLALQDANKKHCSLVITYAIEGKRSLKRCFQIARTSTIMPGIMVKTSLACNRGETIIQTITNDLPQWSGHQSYLIERQKKKEPGRFFLLA